MTWCAALRSYFYGDISGHLRCKAEHSFLPGCIFLPRIFISMPGGGDCSRGKKQGWISASVKAGSVGKIRGTSKWALHPWNGLLQNVPFTIPVPGVRGEGTRSCQTILQAEMQCAKLHSSFLLVLIKPPNLWWLSYGVAGQTRTPEHGCWCERRKTALPSGKFPHSPLRC